MQLRFSRRANCDLEEIGNYIAKRDPLAAKRFVDELHRQCVTIAKQPLSYPGRTALAPGLRMCPHKRYVIFFEVTASAVRIVRIVRASRDIAALF